LAPRRGPEKVLHDNGLGENGTIEDPTQSQCFLARVSQAQAVDESAAELRLDSVISSLPEKGVREADAGTASGEVLATLTSRPAHPSNRLLAQLNGQWRVVNDPLQWILQRRKGNPRKKNSGWKDRCFCTTRDALLRCVREYCGDIDEDALTDLQALPER
jgi:hypothetical protein